VGRNVGEFLQTNAHAFLAVAGRAGEVMRAALIVEHALAQIEHRLFLGVRKAHLHGLVLGHAGNEGGDRVHVITLRAIPFRLDVFGDVHALQRGHAGEHTRLRVLHLVGVLEVARQLRIGAVDDAGAEAEIAFLQRDVLRARGFLPELFAARFEQFGRVAVLQGFPVFFDAFD